MEIKTLADAIKAFPEDYNAARDDAIAFLKDCENSEKYDYSHLEQIANQYEPILFDIAFKDSRNEEYSGYLNDNQFCFIAIFSPIYQDFLEKVFEQ